MAHKTKVNGTTYDITGGKTKVGGTAYSISGGKTKVGGTAYDISFVKIKTFTVDVSKYFSAAPLFEFQFEDGMTWSEFISSEYNEKNATATSNGDWCARLLSGSTVGVVAGQFNAGGGIGEGGAISGAQTITVPALTGDLAMTDEISEGAYTVQ